MTTERLLRTTCLPYPYTGAQLVSPTRIPAHNMSPPPVGSFFHVLFFFDIPIYPPEEGKELAYTGGGDKLCGECRATLRIWYSGVAMAADVERIKRTTDSYEQRILLASNGTSRRWPFHDPALTIAGAPADPGLPALLDVSRTIRFFCRAGQSVFAGGRKEGQFDGNPR